MMANVSIVMLPLADLLEHVMPHKLNGEHAAPLLKVGAFELHLTNHLVMVVIAAVLMLLVFPIIAGQGKKSPVPTGLRNFFEAILSFLRTEVFKPALGANTDRFVPFLWTVFFFILFCNLLGMIPITEIIELTNHYAGTHLPLIGGTATANLMVTAALAVVSFLTIHVSGIVQQVRIQMDPSLDPHHAGHDHAPPHGHGNMIGSVGPDDEKDVVVAHHVGDGHDHAHGVHHAPEGKPFPVACVVGFLHYWKNFVPAVPLILWPLLFVLELAGSLVKPFSLCVRLFANMLAGHLVLGALIALIFFSSNYALRGGVGVGVVLGCSVLSLLELFVAFLQAYIFTFLTTLFIASAVAPEH